MNTIQTAYDGYKMTFEDVSGEVWFNATRAAKKFGKDAFRWFELEATKAYIGFVTQDLAKNETLIKTVIGKGKQQGTWIRKELVIEFARWLDPRFSIWCNKQIEAILLGRSVHTEALKQILMPIPATWQKTFPDYYYLAWSKLYSLEFDRSKGTPSFLGRMTNTYIYEYILRGLPSDLKDARKRYAFDRESDEGLYKLHQFLQEHAKNELRTHIDRVTGVLLAVKTPEQFKAKFEEIFELPNQLALIS